MNATLIPKKLYLKLGGGYSYTLGRMETCKPNAPGGTLVDAFPARRWPAFEDRLLRVDTALTPLSQPR